jgi:hypothetical protein
MLTGRALERRSPFTATAIQSSITVFTLSMVRTVPAPVLDPRRRSPAER